MYNVELTDTINIEIPDSCLNYYSQRIIKDSLLYLYDIKYPDKVDVFCLKNMSFKKRIILKAPGFAQNLAGLFVKNKDSLFVLSQVSKFLYLFNSRGEFINSWNLDYPPFTVADNFTQTDFIFPVMLYEMTPYIDDRLNVYLTIAPLGIESLQNVADKTELQVVYDLKKGDWKYAYAPYKGQMKEKGNKFYPFDLSFPYRLIYDEFVIISYPMDHSIFVYDKNTGDFLKEYCFAVKGLTRFPDGLSVEELDDRKLSWNFRVKTPFYGPVYYHSKVELFSRIYYTKQELLNAKGYVNDGSNRQAIVLLFDKNFKKVEEVVIKNGQMGVHKVIPLPDGYLVAPNMKYWTSENQLVFKYRYVFKKN